MKEAKKLAKKADAQAFKSLQAMDSNMAIQHQSYSNALKAQIKVLNWILGEE